MSPAAAPTTTTTTDVERQLAVYGRLTGEALHARIPSGQPDAWLYDLVRAYPSRPAKSIRPSLCLATCEAFGGSSDHAVLVAATIEMFHNAFLIHDDIADGSLQRRGRATLHAEHGLGLALNAGDGLAVLGQRVLREAVDQMGAELAGEILSEFDTMMARTVEGQAVELGWRRDGVVDLEPEDYLDLIMHKTCWYSTIHPMRVGALLGSRPPADLSPMVRFGFYLGAAFQIRDDILNLVGNEASYGKEILGDLHEGKRTLMLIHLLGAATGADQDRLERYLACPQPERSDSMVSDVRAMMHDHGSIEFATEYAAGIAGAATDAFEDAFADAEPGPARQFVRDLIPFMLERTS